MAERKRWLGCLVALAEDPAFQFAERLRAEALGPDLARALAALAADVVAAGAVARLAAALAAGLARAARWRPARARWLAAATGAL